MPVSKKLESLRSPKDQLQSEVTEFNKKAFEFLKSENLSETNCLNDSIIDDQEYEFSDNEESDKTQKEHSDDE
jgi:hypothetical protein